MFGWLGRILGTPKAIDTLIQNASKGIDALDYTSEEKAHDKQAAVEAARKSIIAFQTATSGQNLARTVIALVILFIWSGSLTLQNGAVVYAIFTSDSGLASNLKEASSLLNTNLEDIHQYFAIILAFYFGEPHLKSIATAIAGKK